MGDPAGGVHPSAVEVDPGVPRMPRHQKVLGPAVSALLSVRLWGGARPRGLVLSNARGHREGPGRRVGGALAGVPPTSRGFLCRGRLRWVWGERHPVRPGDGPRGGRGAGPGQVWHDAQERKHLRRGAAGGSGVRGLPAAEARLCGGRRRVPLPTLGGGRSTKTGIISTPAQTSAAWTGWPC